MLEGIAVKLTLEFSLDSAAFQDGDAGAVEIMRVLEQGKSLVERFYEGGRDEMWLYDSRGEHIGALIVSN